MAHSTIYVGTTSVAEVDELENQDGAYQNEATVTLESLVDRVTGTAVAGLAVPLTLSYVTASNGKYQGTIPHSVSLSSGRWYIATFLAISDGKRTVWEEKARASVREA